MIRPASAAPTTPSIAARNPRPTARRLGVRAAVGLAGAIVLVASTAVPVAAAAVLAIPTGVHVAAVSATSFTVAANPVTRAQGYRLFASTIKSDVYGVNLTSARSSRRIASAAKPLVTIGGLRYSTTIYYYRFEAVTGTHVRYAAIMSVTLRPAAPTNLHVTSNRAGTYLTWSSVPATGFRIAQGTDRALRQNRRDYSIRGASTQFTPWGLVKGVTYYFRVRADNAATPSAYSPAEVSVTVSHREQSLNVMTYNVLTDAADGTQAGSGVVAAWNTQRKAGVVHFIHQGNPDVIGIEEGGGWVTSVHGFGGSRQVDSLKTALSGAYDLATTEIPPSQHGYTRTGNYILYRASAYRAVGAGGHWFLDSSSTAAFQELRNRSTGATFLFVVPHAVVGRGASFDRQREAEVGNLIRLSRARAAGLPVIYAGDFNSYLSPTHSYDGPGRAMRAAHIADGFGVAQALVNQHFNSANQYLRTPPQDSDSIDHIFAEPGVAIRSWSELLTELHGSLVGVIPSDHNAVESVVGVAY